MRVLVACEFSGVVREAFLERGHDAWSCDILPPLYLGDPSGRHLMQDVRPLLRKRWDLVIAHPPCTYLTNSGVQFLGRSGRRAAMGRGARFFLECLAANAPRVCVENPVPHGEARALIGRYTQTVQPYQFGHSVKKITGLWLKGLPPLVPTKVVANPRTCRSPTEGGPSPERKRQRSITYSGIAAAMADQWGSL